MRMAQVVYSYIDQINDMNFQAGGESNIDADKLLHESISADDYYSKINTWYVHTKRKIDLMEKQNGGS